MARVLLQWLTERITCPFPVNILPKWSSWKGSWTCLKHFEKDSRSLRDHKGVKVQLLFFFQIALIELKFINNEHYDILSLNIILKLIDDTPLLLLRLCNLHFYIPPNLHRALVKGTVSSCDILSFLLSSFFLQFASSSTWFIGFWPNLVRMTSGWVATKVINRLTSKVF